MSDCGENVAHSVEPTESVEVEKRELTMPVAVHRVYEALGNDWRLVEPFDIHSDSEKIKRTKSFWNRTKLWMKHYDFLWYFFLVTFLALMASSIVLVSILLVALYWEPGLLYVEQYKLSWWLLPLTAGTLFTWSFVNNISNYLDKNFYPEWKRDLRSKAVPWEVSHTWDTGDDFEYEETGYRLSYGREKLRKIKLTLQSGETTSLYIQSI